MKLIDAEKLIEYIEEKECDLCTWRGTADCDGCSCAAAIFRICEYMSKPENLIGPGGA